MNTTWHLVGEDREDFVRLLDEALATHPPSAPTPGHPSAPPSTEELRALALEAMSAIATSATTEYQRYLQLRETGPIRHTAADTAHTPDAAAASGPAPDATPSTAPPPAGPTEPGDPAGGEPPGAGVGAMVAVLLPVLSAVAAVLFLLVGYVLRVAAPAERSAHALVALGWAFAALSALGCLAAMTGLLLTALRNRAGPAPAPPGPGGPEAELAEAREAWRDALLHRGIEPFLTEVLADPAALPHHVPRTVPPQHAGGGRIPRLGYSGPGFGGDGSGRRDTERT